VCPHSKGALDSELLDGVYIHRFRYAPKSFESLVNGGGILANIKSHKWKLLLIIPFLLGLTYKLIKILRHVRPDVIHVHWIIPQGVVLAFISTFLKLPPMLITSHGGDLFSMDTFVVRLFKRFTLKRFKKITVVNDAMIAKIAEIGLCIKNVKAIPMGVDLDKLFIPNRSFNRVPNRIVFVGRIVEKKGLVFLIRALSKVKARYPNAHLVLAGAGTSLEEANIKKEITKYGLESSVVWLGAVAQSMLPKLYSEAAVFVAPFIKAESGDQEGLGLVAIEAIGCMCPVILGRVPATEKFYMQFESPPALISPQNTDELASSIEHVFDEPDINSKLVARLRNDIYHGLNWDVIARKYSSELNEISL
jgi:glycosyltransferase involved in cell wall biosynthesis